MSGCMNISSLLYINVKQKGNSEERQAQGCNFSIYSAFNSFNGRKRANLLYDLVKCVCVSCFCFNVTILMDEHNKQAPRSMLATLQITVLHQQSHKVTARNVKSNCGGQRFSSNESFIQSVWLSKQTTRCPPGSPHQSE